MFSLYPFATNRLTKSLKCFLYSPKVEKASLVLNAWLQKILKKNVEILNGDNFGGQLVLYEVLFANGYYGFYNLECLKIQFSLLKI